MTRARLRPDRLVVFALCALAATSGAQPMWGYVDGEGVAHLSAERVDGRFLPMQPVPGGGAGPAPQAADRVPGKTDRTDALLTRIEITPQAKAVRPWLREAGAAHGVDPLLLMALIAVESGFDARAVSPAGAVGLMQILPSTADHYATAAERRLPAERRLLDPRTNIHTGARLMADLLARFERIDIALAAWNAGPGTVRRHGSALPPLAETEAHVEQVLQLYWRLLQREQLHRARTFKLPAR